MIRILSLLLILPLTFPSLDNIREKYGKSIKEEKAAETLYADLSAATKREPLRFAYKGAVRAVMAKYAFLPNTKLTYAKEGMKILNEAVKTAPESTEIRYLRYSIEQNIPGFLGFDKHLKGDKAFIVKQLLGDAHGLDQKMFILVRRYMLEKAELDSGMKSKLKNAKP